MLVYASSGGQMTDSVHEKNLRARESQAQDNLLRHKDDFFCCIIWLLPSPPHTHHNLTNKIMHSLQHSFAFALARPLAREWHEDSHIRQKRTCSARWLHLSFLINFSCCWSQTSRDSLEPLGATIQNSEILFL